MRADTDAEDIGHGVMIKRVVDAHGELVGLEYFHPGKDGEPCPGFVPFDTPAGRALSASKGWRVDSFEPITLSPSLLCLSCGHHGFIRDGKREPA